MLRFQQCARRPGGPNLEVLEEAALCGGRVGFLWILQRVRTQGQPVHRRRSHDGEQNPHSAKWNPLLCKYIILNSPLFFT